MSELPTSKSPDPKRQQERTSLEGYLEYAVSISPETSKDSTAPPACHGDGTRVHVPDDEVVGPTTEQVDQTDQECRILLNLPKWRKRALFVCSCALTFLLQFDMAAVAVTIPVSRRHPSTKPPPGPEATERKGRNRQENTPVD